MSDKIYPPLSEREIRGAERSKKAAKEGMVLLKNDRNVLPLSPGKIALFGNGAVRTVRGGSGSGDPFNGGVSGGGELFVNQSPRYHINILPALLESGFDIVTKEILENLAERLDAIVSEAAAAGKHDVLSPEQEVSEADAKRFSDMTDTAVYVLSRNSGEGRDRKVEDDYDLSPVEKKNLRVLREAYKNLVLVLNVPGPVSAADLQESEADAILLMGQPGQEAGLAVSEVLTGETTPSGKLTTTWAMEYRDYPSADTFLSDPDTSLYTEGIYVGYRYFTTVKKQAGYPFGFGLSYTDFAVFGASASISGQDIVVSAKVRNCGNFDGKEVLQLYVSAPSTEMDMPERELKGFKKTSLLKPGEEETLVITVPLKALSSFSEEKTAYLLSRGYYILKLGTSSENTDNIAAVCIPESRLTKLVYEELPLAQPLDVMKGLEGNDNSKEASSLPILLPEDFPVCEDARSPYQTPCVTTYTTDPDYTAVMPYEKVQLVEKKDITLQDVYDGRASYEELLAQFTEEELSNFACGTGWGVADDANPVIGSSSESVPGAAGETTHNLEKRFKIPAIVLADGPGGVRLTQQFTAKNIDTGEDQTVYHHCISWPVGTLIAQSFDPDVAREVGLGMKEDLKAFRIEVLLGPGINIHRNPLCGRNFEYFSEDPFLSGQMAAAMTLGIQDGYEAAACVKHYAANNQETNRHKNDSVVSQRALREIYLEPFRVAIEKGKALTVMTSYNKINGVPTADSYDLCTNLLRGEWGFEGFVMTDWNGGSSTASISMFAGNDLIMPGGISKELNILLNVAHRMPEFDERGEVRKIADKPFPLNGQLLPIYTLKWNSFRPDKDGDTEVEARLEDGHTAEIRDGLILVDGEKIYTEAGFIMDIFRLKEKYEPLKTPLTTEVARISEDGKSIFYKGFDTFRQTICIGDIEARAKNILKVMEKLGRIEN